MNATKMREGGGRKGVGGVGGGSPGSVAGELSSLRDVTALAGSEYVIKVATHTPGATEAPASLNLKWFV